MAELVDVIVNQRDRGRNTLAAESDKKKHFVAVDFDPHLLTSINP